LGHCVGLGVGRTAKPLGVYGFRNLEWLAKSHEVASVCS
jgi:hypothetical protein